MHTSICRLIGFANRQTNYVNISFSHVQHAVYIQYLLLTVRLSHGVTNLRYMYPLGYICLSEGVHLRLSVEEQNILAYNLFQNIYTYISEYSFQISLYAYCEIYL